MHEARAWNRLAHAVVIDNRHDICVFNVMEQNSDATL